MRNFLLSAPLAAAPVCVVAVGYIWLTPKQVQAQTATAPASGDMKPFSIIVTDVQSIAASGDLAGAEKRITDLETAWDKAAPTLRPVNATAWGNIDGLLDDALSALRTGKPDAAQVDTTLVSLQKVLADPTFAGVGGTGVVATVNGVATSDANGRSLPCEEMLRSFRTNLVKASLSDANRATVGTLQAKGTERCNADDDARADDLFAQGIALMSN